MIESLTDSAQRPGGALQAPLAQAFARYPRSWYIVCPGRRLRRGQVLKRELCGRRLVVFRTGSGRVAVLDARCAHFGADLGAGRVVGDDIECPYHRFRFSPEGRCAGGRLRQTAYPVEERYGQVFVFLGKKPSFELPEFPVPDGTELSFAPSFHLDLRAAWYMVGANAFDVRHFKISHARKLLGEPLRYAPRRHCHRIGYRFQVAGGSVVDRATRRWCGPEVEFDITAWAGNIVLVCTRFERDRSYGMVVAEPRGGADEPSVHIRVVVGAERRSGALAARLSAWLRAALKRYAVHAMVSSDVAGLDGLVNMPDGLQPGDEDLAGYLRWISNAVPCAGSGMCEGVSGDEGMDASELEGERDSTMDSRKDAGGVAGHDPPSRAVRGG